ncbi:glycosyltransferase family 4 protein [Patescibacteria group bacterium]|nr:glycosyltransferase family 4 protein [Patescibacteria group bacterium]MBU1673683.1 glycosyltransferase family 4 protein [Patescibacteria group bacterium]MBU1963493.1 glycosyltransferase family 4 protein [Patescibacteria group bacterium]
MKIAHLAPATIKFPVHGDQGRWILVSSLIKEQIKRGHDVTIFSNAKSTFPGAKLQSVPSLWLCKDCTAEEKKKWKMHATNLLLSKAYQQADKFDIIHSHLNERHLFFSPFTKTPTVVTQHWPFNETIVNLFKEVAPKNVWVTPISNSQKKQGEGIVRYTQTVYNGIDLNKFKFDPDPKNYFVFLGRLHPNKGCHLAIQAAIKLNVRLIIAGATHENQPIYKNYWDEKIKPYLIHPKIKYIGEIRHTQVNTLLKDAKALVFPIQWEEPFGLVMVESMASGTPVISFNKGSVPELVKDGQTGFVINENKQVAQAMEKIDTINRRDCRAWVKENFSLQKMVAGYEEVYKKIIDNKK